MYMYVYQWWFGANHDVGTVVTTAFYLLKVILLSFLPVPRVTKQKENVSIVLSPRAYESRICTSAHSLHDWMKSCSSLFLLHVLQYVKQLCCSLNSSRPQRSPCGLSVFRSLYFSVPPFFSLCDLGDLFYFSLVIGIVLSWMNCLYNNTKLLLFSRAAPTRRSR